MSASSASPLLPAVQQSSNLSHYRALFQLFTYARKKRQSAADVVRDAMTGGVVVPFDLPSQSDRCPSAAETSDPAAAREGTSVLLMVAEQSLPIDMLGPHAHTTAATQTLSPLLLLPSSKCVATLAFLLADGFFNLAPLSTTAENVRGASYQIRSEAEPRDFFTLLALLYPDCLVPEDELPALVALRRSDTAAAASAAAASLPPSSRDGASGQGTPLTLRAVSPATSLPTSVMASRILRSLPMHTSRPGRAQEESVSANLTPLPLTDTSADSFAASRSAHPSTSPQVLSPTRMALLEVPLEVSQVESASVSAAAAATTGAGGDGVSFSAAHRLLPEVDPVSLTVNDLEVLLECRRSLATVFLSTLNEALHDVQLRELERGRPTANSTNISTAAHCCEAATLHAMSELLLVTKALLMTLMAAAEVWWRRWREQHAASSDGEQGELCCANPSPSFAPHDVFCHLLKDDTDAAARYTSAAVEDWSWGHDKEALERWYDERLQHLLRSTEAAGVRLDTFLQVSKSSAVKQGRSVTHTPALVLHRPSDGHPAVKLSLSSVSHLHRTVALPVMPLQVGEVQLLLHPCVAVRSRRGVSSVSYGHEMLFDATPSPTAEFLHSCTTTVCPPAMLQGTGAGQPTLLRHRFASLSASERGVVTAFLADPQLLAAILERNAAMLARLTLWAEGLWPPPCASLMDKGTVTSASFAMEAAAAAAVTELVTSEDGYQLSAGVKEAVLFCRPFTAAVGRYVREVLLLKGFDQMTLERWIRKVCKDMAEDATFAKHRRTLSALVKFAALQSRWTWTSEINDLQKLHLP